MRSFFWTILCVATWSFTVSAGQAAEAKKFLVVAAENTWGDLAAQIAGSDMSVTSVLEKPVPDPHSYEPGPSEGRLVSDATLVVSNGAGYDTWIERLAQTRPKNAAPLLRVQDIAGWHEGDNVHLWLNVAAVEAFVKAFAEACQKADPAHAGAYAKRAQKLQNAIDQLKHTLAAARSVVAGQPVAATETVFSPLANELQLVMKEKGFQLAVMNDVEPAPLDVAEFENDIRQHRIHVLIYNSQVNRPSAERLVAIAKQYDIPVLSVSENMPQGEHWQSWVGGLVTQVATDVSGAQK